MDSIGRFIAYQLSSRELAGSCAFYRAVFRWQFDEAQRVTGGGPQWCRFLDEPGAERSAWLGYLTTPNLPDAIELAHELGGTTIIDAHDDEQLRLGRARALGGGEAQERFGRVAILRDPDGARFGLVQTRGDDPEDLAEQPAPGVIAWNVLISREPERSLHFYMHLFGWTAERHELPEVGTYLICEREGLATAGIVRARDDVTEGEWLSAIAVRDLDEAHAMALRLGATPRWQPTSIPQIGRFSVVFDPSGARVAMLEIDENEEFG